MFLNILEIIVGIVLIVLCLLQGGKADGIVSALSGQSSNLFSETKERGSELVLTRVTAVLGIIFFVLAVLKQMG